MEQRIYYKRNLPHYQPLDAVYFATFRLANSLPKSVIEQLRIENLKQTNKIESLKNKKERENKLYHQQKRYFGKFDSLLDNSTSGSVWLKDERVAKLVSDSIRFRDNKEYDLYAYCVMPNHVHMLFDVTRNAVSRHNVAETYIVTRILQSLKMFTARDANEILERKGQFWHRESYDHIVRNQEEFINVVDYIIQNPVKAGLVKNWRDWKWTYVRDDL